MPSASDTKNSILVPFFNPEELAKVLVIGIGNSGLSDDGLGWAFLDVLEERSFFTGKTAYRYQLQIEDAELISRLPAVIFVDASAVDIANGFEWTECRPDGDFSFSTHELSPGTVLGLCRHVYGKSPRAYTLAIQGYEWDLREGLSGRAIRNLSKAVQDFAERCIGTTA